MIGTLLGRTEHDEVVAEGVRAPFAAELFKRLALGGGMTVGASVVWGAFELLRNDPHDAFPLLRSWGSGTVITLVAIYVVYDIAKIVLNIAKRGVIAMEGLSHSVQQIASKDDRQLQELQTLTAYTSQESERNSASLRDLHTKVDNMLGILSSRAGEKAS